MGFMKFPNNSKGGCIDKGYPKNIQIFKGEKATTGNFNFKEGVKTLAETVKNILDFKVLPPEFDSKHAPITTTFKISELRTEKRKLFNLPTVYKWDSQRGEIFQSLLNDNETKRWLEVLCDQLKEKNKPGNIQDITKAFTKILTTCADKSLTLKRKKNTQKRLSKPWYNNSCSSQ